ncbi:DUF2922 family protein [Enterococcus raffinosus]|uniref:DUF2922 family protein n=1 Tax=Enterococcus raffinosus TaxID=71452 RepID=A0AAW8T8C8_9ENTE|nr:DUF2922 family protein [Enterococcus raffinosus]MDT2523239.1 DUF2922 family protein [Enterococcus raffinosus]MDT2531257.1 DUF2922 family protein [Enterococcus raffinosus]MDT2533941.1 DUF2922 family protein [Enterococcus raffinosus]MDT2544716.1 DUF2922 family protein [Enterococcus raffinosus]MDT2555988.1 DUF2922 family protein [Enterococcus raffinosus]
MRQDLVATFTNSLGKTHDWKYNNLKNDLPIPVIKEACELLTTLDIFEENGVKLFDKVVTAKIITTKETEIFDKEKEPEEAICEKEKTVPSPKIEKEPEMPAVKTGNSYDYLFNTSRTAIAKSLEEPAETRNDSPSLIINAPQIGEKTITSLENTAAEDSSNLSAAQSNVPEQDNTQKGFLARLRQKINRNKDDPDIRSRDGDSSS